MSVAPLTELGRLGEGGALAAALVVGVAFGWWLERGGMGSARKLAGQFYLADFAVLKLMLTAIVTAALGLFWLGRLGVVELSLVHVPETWLVPQAVGGALFGVGFVLAGLCPGTSCVAAATGRLDGLAVLAGLLGGVLAFGELVPAIGDFAASTPRGALTLPALLGVPAGAATFGVVAAALALFALVERLERRRRESEGARRSPFARGLGIAALSAGALALAAGRAEPDARGRVDVERLAREVEREEDHVTALELARWIRERHPGLRVVDVRDAESYDAFHIPGAVRLGLEALARAPFAEEETVVLYSEGGAHAAQGWFLVRARGHERVFFLREGLYEWMRDVMEPALPADADSAARAAWPEVAALSRWFGGMPRIGERSAIPDEAIAAPARADSRAAVARVRRRGC